MSRVQAPDSAVIALRNKYAEDLEEILQCPVCFDTLSGPVPMCTQGHHVCMKCQPQIPNCPFCKSFFNGTRNYLAENLATKFDEIKISLLDPKHHSNKKVLNNVSSVETQTDPEMFNNENITTLTINESTVISENLINFKTAPPVGKGKYPCKIEECTEELPHGRMIPHLRYYHEKCLIEENPIDNGFYSQCWELSYYFPQAFDRVISIPNMGLFFMNIYFTVEGDLHGSVQIVNTSIQAKQFHYSLEIGNSHNSTVYKGCVLTCRRLKSKIFEKALYINNEYVKYLLKKMRTKFNCSLTITRLSDAELSFNKSSSHSSLNMES